MFYSRKPKQETILGIDLQATSVNIIGISYGHSDYCIEGYAYRFLSGSPEPSAFVAAISDMVRAFSFHKPRAVIAIPDSDVIRKVIQVDAGLCDADIEALVSLDVAQSSPSRASPTHFDFKRLGRHSKNTSQEDIFMVVSYADTVKKRIDLLRTAAIEVAVVDIASYAIERVMALLPSVYQDRTHKTIIAVVIITDAAISLFVFRDGEVIFTQAIASDYHLWTPDSVLTQMQSMLESFYAATHEEAVNYVIWGGEWILQRDMMAIFPQKLPVNQIGVEDFYHLQISDRLNGPRFFNRFHYG